MSGKWVTTLSQQPHLDRGYMVRFYTVGADGVARSEYWSITGLGDRRGQARFDHAEMVAQRKLEAGAEWAELIEADTDLVVASVRAAAEEAGE